jgi:dimethylargininase
LGACELSFLERVTIDVDRALAQHRAYVAALEALCVAVEALPPEPDLADATFVEDPAIVLDELAIICRPVASRRPEVPSIAAAVARWRALVHIDEPGTLEGGDVLVVDRRVFVARSQRSNAAGIAQLAELVAPHAYTVEPVDISGCLHLKSAVSHLGDGAFLVNPTWIDAGVFAPRASIDVDPAEPFAANTVSFDGTVLMPASAPRTIDRVRAMGFEVVPVAVDELEKAEAGLSCMSLRFFA